MKQGYLSLLAACCILSLLLASTALSQQTPADQKQEKPKGLNELLLGNLAGILGGVAAIIAAVLSRKNNKETQEKTRSELSSFKKDLRGELVDGETIRIIAKQGDFLSKRDLKEALTESIEEGRIRIELLKVEQRLAETERTVVDHDERIFKLERPGEQLESKVDELRDFLARLNLKGK
jgi:hypothetical protein